MSRFQQEIRSLTMKIAELERRTEEKKASTIDLKKELDRVSRRSRTVHQACSCPLDQSRSNTDSLSFRVLGK